MVVPANGTDAKEICVYFASMTNVQIDYRRSMVQAKRLLSDGYTKHDVMITIDYLLSHGKMMYSLGYVSASIANVIDKARELDRLINQPVSEVKVDASTAERNREKSDRFGKKGKWESKFGELFDQE